MGYLTDISKEKIEKIGLVVVRPRIRHTGWTLVSGFRYQTTFELGVPSAVWENYDPTAPAIYQRTDDLPGMTLGQFHYDHETKVLTIESAYLGDPDSRPLPGITVEFEVHLATRPIYGRRDPLDGTFPDIVEWEPAIKEAPSATNGSQNDIFGFQPVSIASIQVANDGWLNELLYDVSWNLAPIAAYILTGSDYETGVQSSGVVQTFTGYVAAISESGKVLSISCSDYTKKLDSTFATRFFSVGLGTVDPAAIKLGEEWRIPKIFGAVDSVEGVNIDYNASPSTTNNRKWVTHDTEGNAVGDLTLTIDHTQPNTATRTYFTTTPGLNVYDHFVLNHASGTKRVIASAVNRTAKYVDHTSAAGRVIVAGETATRPFIGAAYLVDRDGNRIDLTPGVDFNTFVDLANQVAGFQLVNNFEASAGAFHTPFDPTQDKIIVRVYGTSDLPTYDDASPVGAPSRASGVGAEGISILARFLNAAGIYHDQWDNTSFQSVGAGSHTLGFMVPPNRGGTAQTYKEVISQLLNSQLWKLALTLATDGKQKIGLVAVQPFPAPFDYAIDKTELFDFEWEHDYADIYSDLVARYKVARESVPDGFQLGTSITDQESLTAKYVHLVNQEFQIELAQFDQEEAEAVAARLMFILGERRGIYKLKLPYTQLLNAKVGAAYQVTRDHLPGFAYAFDAENARTLNLIEVQKDLSSVSLVLEDQKGVQDNAGDW